MQESQPPQSSQPPPEQPIPPPYSSQPPYGQPAFPGSSPQPPAYGYYPSPPPYQAPAYAPPTSATAIVSLVASISSWVFLPFIGAIVGIICGHIARAEIRRSNGAVQGNGLALAGLIIGYVHIALAVAVILIIALIAIGYSAASSSSSLLIT